jgi:outer membrane protein insertion porin family
VPRERGEEMILKQKWVLPKDRVLTENMKLSAIEVIRKFYYEKGYRNVTIDMVEEQITGITNGVRLTFNINKGNKVRINSINFSGNEQIEDAKLKKKMKGTKEMTRFTLFPQQPVSPYGDSSKGLTFKKYLKEVGFLKPSKTKELIDPYFRFKLFSGAKFNETKYIEDKDKVLEFYNSQGYRDAMMLADTLMLNSKGNLDIDMKISEGT